MPTFDQRDRYATGGLGDALLDAPIEDEAPDWFSETLPAVLQREHTLGSLYARLKAPSPEYGIQTPAFNPFNDIAGYEEHAWDFIDSDSAEDMNMVKHRIDLERRRTEVVYQGGAMTALTLLAAGVMDPINLIPVGGAAVKAYRGGNLLKGALLTAAAGAGGMTAAEVAFHSTQLDRTLTESSFNVGGATVLSGILGGAVGLLTRGQMRALGKLIEDDLSGRPPKSAIAGGSGELTQLEAESRTLRAALGEPNPRQLSAEDLKLKDIIPGTEKLGVLGKLSPQVRAMTSGTAVGRAIVEMLTEVPFIHERNAKGLTTGGVRIARTEPTGVQGARGTAKLGAAPTPTDLARFTEAAEARAVAFQNRVGRPISDAEASKLTRDLAKQLAKPVGDVAADLKAAKSAVRAAERRIESLKPKAKELVKEGIVGKGAPFRTATLAREAAKADLEAAATALENLQLQSDLGAQAAAREVALGPFRVGDEVEVLAFRGDEGSKQALVRGPDGTEEWVPIENLLADATHGFERKAVHGETQATEEFGRPIVLEDEGAVAVETKVKHSFGKLGLAYEKGRDAFLDYKRAATGRDLKSFALLRFAIADARSPFAGKRPLDLSNMSYKQFMEQVGKALRNNDAHPIPQVVTAAKAKREFFDELLERAIAVKLLPKGLDSKTAPSYLTRVWNVKALINTRARFLQVTESWLRREHPDLTGGEAEVVARDIHSKLIGHNGGRIPYDMEISSASPLSHRTFTIEDRLVEEWLESDADMIAEYYWRTVAPDVALSEVFGDPGMSNAFKALDDEYGLKLDLLGQARAADEITAKELSDASEYVTAERAAVRRDIEAMRDRVRGTYAAPENPNSMPVRVSRFARASNLLAQGGGFVISSLADIGRPVMIHGLSRTMKHAIVPMIRDFKGFRLAREELKLAGIGWEVILDSRSVSLYDLGSQYRGLTVGEEAVRAAASKMSVANLLAPWNTAAKQWAGVVTQGRMLTAIRQFAEATESGKPISKKLAKEMGYLRQQRISEKDALGIAAEFGKFGQDREGLFLANSLDWEDRRLAELFNGATVSEVDRIIVTPGVGDRPLWMSSELGKTLTQYKSFSVAATNRVFLSGLQQRDAAVASGTLLSLGMGGFIYALKEMEKGNELSDDLATWAAEMADRSGIFGVLSEVSQVGAKAFGFAGTTRYSSRNVVGSLMGPSFGSAGTLVELAGAVGRGEITQADTNNVKRLLWYHQLFYTRGLFDKMAEGVNEALDIPEKSRGRR